MTAAFWDARDQTVHGRQLCIRLSVLDGVTTVTTLDQTASAPDHDEDRPDFAVWLFTGTRRAIAWLTGDLDRSSAPRLQQTLLQLYRDGYQHVVLNLSGVSFLDLANVDVLARAAEQFRAAGREFVLTQPTRVALRVLEIIHPHTTHLHAALHARNCSPRI